MNRSSPEEMIINRVKAQLEIEATEDPATQEILKIAQYQVLKAFIKFSDPPMTDEEFSSQLPIAPFDMYFYIKLVKNTVKNKDLLIRILSGDLDSTSHVW